MTEQSQLKAISEQVADFYNRVHKVITFPGNSVQSYRTTDIGPTHDDIIKDSSVQAGMKILDAGCGLGAFDFYLGSRVNCDITAITYSKEEFQVATTLYGSKSVKGKLEYQLADFHFLRDKFSDNSFDMVMFLESFEHVYDKEKVLRDTYAVIRPGGCLFIKYHFLLWTNSVGREEKFKASMQNETTAWNTFTHITLPDFLKLTYEIGYTPQLVKIPSIQFDFYKASMDNIAICNENLPGFNYVQPDFQVSQCYNVLLKKS